MGGVWFDATPSTSQPPLLWRARFPDSVQQGLITATNRQGSLSYPTWSWRPPLCTKRSSQTFATSMNAPSGSPATTGPPWRGPPRARPQPPRRVPTCYVSTRSTSGPTATSPDITTSPDPSIVWLMMPAASGTSLTLPSSHTLTLPTPRSFLGACATRASRCSPQ
jgi:hypothetical protein